MSAPFLSGSWPVFLGCIQCCGSWYALLVVNHFTGLVFRRVYQFSAHIQWKQIVERKCGRRHTHTFYVLMLLVGLQKLWLNLPPGGRGWCVKKNVQIYNCSIYSFTLAAWVEEENRKKRKGLPINNRTTVKRIKIRLSYAHCDIYASAFYTIFLDQSNWSSKRVLCTDMGITSKIAGYFLIIWWYFEDCFHLLFLFHSPNTTTTMCECPCIFHSFHFFRHPPLLWQMFQFWLLLLLSIRSVSINT